MHPVDKNIGLYILKKYGITGIRRRLGIAVRNWQDHEAYKDAIAAAADELQEKQDVHVIFIQCSTRPMSKRAAILPAA